MAELDPFYVGYRKMPAAIRRFVVPWLVGNLVLAVGVAALIAQQQREPGDGTWDTGRAVTFEGDLIAQPYPLICVDHRHYLLVEQGKFGVQQRLASGQIKEGPVVATGFLVERDGRRVLELDGSSGQALRQSETYEPSSAMLRVIVWHAMFDDLGTHTLRGEIVDPKCYLGVMQPGDGKTHKTCATLCITGGIPPMFVVKDAQGHSAAYLLTDPHGRPIPESVYPYIADPVELTGRVYRNGDLLVLRADLDTIRRLGPGD